MNTMKHAKKKPQVENSVLYVDKSVGSKEYGDPLRNIFRAQNLSPSLVVTANTGSEVFGHGGGDFVFLGNGPDEEQILIGVELKNISDFVHSSLSSDRLGSFQLPNMASAYQRLYLIIEGSYSRGERGELTCLVSDTRFQSACLQWEPIFLGRTADGNRGMPYSRFIGQLHSLGVGYDLTILTANTKDITANTIYSIWSFWQKPYSSHSFANSRVLKSPSRNMVPGGTSNVFRYLTLCVPGIGNDKARVLASEYTTLEELMSANPRDIQKVEGAKVGSTLANRIWNSFRERK